MGFGEKTMGLKKFLGFLCLIFHFLWSIFFKCDEILLWTRKMVKGWEFPFCENLFFDFFFFFCYFSAKIMEIYFIIIYVVNRWKYFESIRNSSNMSVIHLFRSNLSSFFFIYLDKRSNLGGINILYDYRHTREFVYA